MENLFKFLGFLSFICSRGHIVLFKVKYIEGLCVELNFHLSTSLISVKRNGYWTILIILIEKTFSTIMAKLRSLDLYTTHSDNTILIALVIIKANHGRFRHVSRILKNLFCMDLILTSISVSFKMQFECIFYYLIFLR